MPGRIRAKTVSAYLQSMPAPSAKKLRQLRAGIRAAAPGAVEGIKWGMPAFSTKRILVMYAGFKRHIGFYPTPSAVGKFKGELKPYKTAMGSIQFPLDKPLPMALIKRIVKFRVKESRQQDAMWRSRR